MTSYDGYPSQAYVWRSRANGRVYAVTGEHAIERWVQLAPAEQNPDTRAWVYDSSAPRVTVATGDVLGRYEPVQREPLRNPRIERVAQLGEEFLEQLLVLDPAAAALADRWHAAVTELRELPAAARRQRARAHWLGSQRR